MNFLSSPLVYLIIALCASYALSQVVKKGRNREPSFYIPLAHESHQGNQDAAPFSEMVLRCQKIRSGDFR
jgi:hypothetical protein